VPYRGRSCESRAYGKCPAHRDMRTRRRRTECEYAECTQQYYRKPYADLRGPYATPSRNLAPNKFRERLSDASIEYKKPFSRPGSAGAPLEELRSIQRSPRPFSWWEGLASPLKNPGPLGFGPDRWTRNRRLGPSQHDGLDPPMS